MIPLSGNEIRKVIIVIRKQTKTRAAIRITVTQEMKEDESLALPTIELSGDIPKLMESARFARDLANALLVAAYYHTEWSHYVDGKR